MDKKMTLCENVESLAAIGRLLGASSVSLDKALSKVDGIEFNGGVCPADLRDRLDKITTEISKLGIDVDFYHDALSWRSNVEKAVIPNKDKEEDMTEFYW